MCRVAQRRFPDQPIVAARAREFVGETLRGWQLPLLVDDVELAVTELVTNAVLHARTPILVTLCVENGTAEVAVTDYDPRTPRLLSHRDDLLGDLDALGTGGSDADDPRHAGLHYGPSGSVTAGRGLIILDAISDQWGVTPHAEGKDVWARLPVPGDWPHTDRCRCGHSDAAATASGRPVEHISGPWDG